MNPHNLGPLFDEGLILVIAVFLTIKGLILRRRTGVGRALGRNNFAFAAAYYGVFLGTVIGVEAFRTEAWRWGIRSVIAFTLGHAIWEMMIYYGGWRGLWEEIRLNLVEFRDSWIEWGQMAAYRARRLWGRTGARVAFLLLIATLAACAVAAAR